MHILVTNDDGPPSAASSPYVLPFVRELQSVGHLVSVVLPASQKSWIGKAHIVGRTVTSTYYLPPTGDDPHDLSTEETRPSPRPHSSDREEWVLLDTTPASCVQIGLYHLFNSRPPIDLVVSGPNLGRNATSVFALSSGTLGAALEAATCRTPAIALSFAFFDRAMIREPGRVKDACRLSVKLVEKLASEWPAPTSKAERIISRTGPVLAQGATTAGILATVGAAANQGSMADVVQAGAAAVGMAVGGATIAEGVGGIGLEAAKGEAKGLAKVRQAYEDGTIVQEGIPQVFTINVPLVPDVDTHRVVWASMLPNSWSSGSAFEAVGLETTDEPPDPKSEVEIRERGEEAASGENDKRGSPNPNQHVRYEHKQFRWAPRFKDVYESVEQSSPGNDGWAVQQGYTSVTPLFANFMHTPGFEGDIEL